MCAGVLDDTHIPIFAPVSYPSDYCNRKEWFSVFPKGLVDPIHSFIDFGVVWPGKCHDACVFEFSICATSWKDGTFISVFSRNRGRLGQPTMPT